MLAPGGVAKVEQGDLFGKRAVVQSCQMDEISAIT